MDRLLSVDEAAETLGLSSWTIRAWIGSGRIGSTKLGSRRLIPSSEVTRLITEGTTPASEPTTNLPRAAEK
jgi:excisionase family DNA binding protein